jgi:hypothetical protein
MFQQSEEPMLINDEKNAAHVFLYGQTVQPIVLSTAGRYEIIVVSVDCAKLIPANSPVELLLVWLFS